MRFPTACTFLVILAISPFALGQNRIEFDFGVRTGVPLTVPFESRLTGPASTFSSYAFSKPPVTAGPTLAVVVYDRVVIQFDALYQRNTIKSSFYNGTTFISSSARSSWWEFPLIADYAVLQGTLRPFGGGGMLLGETFSDRFQSQLPAFVINGGLEWRMPHIVIRPELRYTRWQSVSQSTAVAHRENQFAFLAGFSFRGSKRERYRDHRPC